MKSTVFLAAALAGLASAISFEELAERGAEQVVAGFEAVQIVENIIRRQDSQSSATTTGTARPASSSPATTAKATLSGSSTGSSTGAKTSGAASGSANTTAYDLNDPVGGISMISPNLLSGSEYYKVGNWITFAWNFTGVQGTPTAINALASCSQNNAVYTIEANRTYENPMTVLWDTSKTQDPNGNDMPNYIMGKYTLVVENADEAVATGGAKPGYFNMDSKFQFAMYTPQPYTPWAQYNCPTCSGGVSAAERQQLGFLFGMFAITVMSFTWFATGRFNVL